MDAVKTTKGSTRKKDYLALLITKDLQVLNLSLFPSLNKKLVAHLLHFAAYQQSVTSLPHFLGLRSLYRTLILLQS